MKKYTFMIVVLLSACSTMSKKECREANWNDIGKKDGLNGMAISIFDTAYVKDCAKTDIVPDRESYTQGRYEGLKKYCTISSAYGVGENGWYYRGVCGDFDEPNFLRGYKLGKELYQYKKYIDTAHKHTGKINSTISEMENHSNKLWKEIKSSESNLTSHQIQQKRNIIDQNKANINALKIKLIDAESVVDQKQEKYNKLKEKHLKLGFCGQNTCFEK